MPRSSTSTERTVYIITFRPEPGIDGLRAVRALLKLALRALGLRCIRINNAMPCGDEHGDQVKDT
jgi:hypothetical protein